MIISYIAYICDYDIIIMITILYLYITEKQSHQCVTQQQTETEIARFIIAYRYMSSLRSRDLHLRAAYIFILAASMHGLRMMKIWKSIHLHSISISNQCALYLSLHPQSAVSRQSAVIYDFAFYTPVRFSMPKQDPPMMRSMLFSYRCLLAVSVAS